MFFLSNTDFWPLPFHSGLIPGISQFSLGGYGGYGMSEDLFNIVSSSANSLI